MTRHHDPLLGYPLKLSLRGWIKVYLRRLRYTVASFLLRRLP